MAEQTASPRPAKPHYPLPAWGGLPKGFEPLTGQFAARELDGGTWAGTGETYWPPTSPHA